MRVILLGAGASHAAGYPLTAGLMQTLAELADQSASVQLRESWQTWQDFLDSLPRELELIARNSNPEIVLSLPDLFTLAVEQEDRHRQATAMQVYRTGGEAPIEDLERYFNSAERDALQMAARGRARFLSCLDEFFWYRHHYDADARSARDYLRSLFSDLIAGDVVVTLNWDTTAERTLAEDGRWNPITGYGFSRPLCLARPMNDPMELPDEFPRESEIEVLKLHGSFGWRQTHNGVYFEGTRFLREFGFRVQGRDIELVDPEEPHVAIHDDLFLSYPSFLKQLSHPLVDELWRKASACMLAADQVDVWGYSLPPSDGAMRAFLQPLSDRLRRGDVSVAVHSPDRPVLECWRGFLGETAEFKRERLTQTGIEQVQS